MTQVHGSSTINIAATAAVDSGQGIFYGTLKYGTNSFFASGKRTKETFLHCVPDNLYDHAIGSSPLANRGWIVQERLLSPRTLHFSEYGLFWECNEIVACETFPESLPSIMRYNCHSFFDKKPLSRYTWNDIVKLYSSGQLTYGSDKLVAIAGIARQFSGSQHCKYAAGLWEGDDFVSQLLWRSRYPQDRPSPSQGPTWSWCSVNSPVYWPSYTLPRRLQNHIQLLDNEIELPGPGSDPFGVVLKATLFLLCDELWLIDAVTALELDARSCMNLDCNCLDDISGIYT